MVGRGRTLLREILGQSDPLTSKTAIVDRYPLVAPQPVRNVQ